ncbi:hypothetical protein P0136_01240 [Lentisphaerota bacterium ZTH]|nr:hypothetical protein JYG24_07620 [Lentisphaerota bacterium]WET06638.1 hypothetical protein P0136_01240 [Lentisphaerota bacterium ZTH]
MKHFFSAFVVLSSFLLCGCGSLHEYNYPPQDAKQVYFSNVPLFSDPVTVVTLRDKRPSMQEDEFGTVFLSLIPAWPYGYSVNTQPEHGAFFNSAKGFRFNAGRDLTMSVKQSLEHSRMFKQVKFSRDMRDVTTRLVLTGDIESTEYVGRIWSYGISVFCPGLWVLGLPVGNFTNHLAFTLKLLDTKTGKVLWTYKVDDSGSRVFGLYYNYGRDFDDYSPLMLKAMNKALGRLESDIRLEQDKFGVTRSPL